MHKTKAGEKRRALTRMARELSRDSKVMQKDAKNLPEARQEAQRLQADKALVESETLKMAGYLGGGGGRLCSIVESL